MSKSSGIKFFPKGNYLSQLRTGPDPENYDGEYRGFYPNGNIWKPKSSHYLGRSSSHPHRGIDIYAPYAPHPLETPVCAVVEGTVYFRNNLIEPQQLGNRAELKFGDNLEKLFSYGHLSRFEGRDGRKVKAGDIIGYAGCSGNANTAGECSKCGVCNINSGHVHLSVRGPANMDRNPLSHCKLRLRFSDGDALLKEQKCSDWVDPIKGKGLKDKWTPDPPKATKLIGVNELNWRRVKGRRAELSEPFALLEFDSTNELRTTHQFYVQCGKRLDKLAKLKSPKSSSDKVLKKFLTRIRDDAVSELNEKGRKRLADLRKSIGVKDKEVFGLGESDDAARVPGWLLRHMSTLSQMCWVVFGGAALDRLADNQSRDSDGKPTYKTLPILGAKGAHKELRAHHLPQCGAGVGGVACLSANDTARNALHVTKLKKNFEQGEKSYWVASITFGAGSLMHATITELMKHPDYSNATSSLETDEGIARYIKLTANAASKLWELHIHARIHQVALSNELENSPSNGNTRSQVLSLMREKIIATGNAFAACNELVDEKLAKALLLRMVQTNKQLFQELIQISTEPEGQLPVGPAFFMLKTRDV